MLTDILNQVEYKQNDKSLFMNKSRINCSDMIKGDNLNEVISEEEFVTSSKIDCLYNSEDFESIEKVLSNHFFIRTLERSYLTKIIKEMFIFKIDKNQILFKQGDENNNFYIIKEGSLNFYDNEKFVKTLIRGESIGLDLVHSSIRSQTVKANENCQLWVLKGCIFVEVVEYLNNLYYQEFKDYLFNSPFFRYLDDEKISKICHYVTKEIYDKNDHIIKGNYYY